MFNAIRELEEYLKVSKHNLTELKKNARIPLQLVSNTGTTKYTYKDQQELIDRFKGYATR